MSTFKIPYQFCGVWLSAMNDGALTDNQQEKATCQAAPDSTP
jgi:hypothetical protein